MRIVYSLNRPLNLVVTLRQMGYHPITDHPANHTSWVKTLGYYYYPRFHLYVETISATNLEMDLHLDQQQAKMKLPGLNRHGGEYYGSVVEQEVERIKRWLNYLSL